MEVITKYNKWLDEKQSTTQRSRKKYVKVNFDAVVVCCVCVCIYGLVWWAGNSKLIHLCVRWWREEIGSSCRRHRLFCYRFTYANFMYLTGSRSTKEHFTVIYLSVGNKRSRERWQTGRIYIYSTKHVHMAYDWYRFVRANTFTSKMNDERKKVNCETDRRKEIYDQNRRLATFNGLGLSLTSLSLFGGTSDAFTDTRMSLTRYTIESKYVENDNQNK